MLEAIGLVFGKRKFQGPARGVPDLHCCNDRQKIRNGFSHLICLACTGNLRGPESDFVGDPLSYPPD